VKRRQATYLLLGLFLTLGAAPARAQDRSLHRLATLVKEADAIVLGTCESAVSTWDERHRFIATRATVRTSRQFKGTIGDTVTVQTLGGQVGDVGMVASHGASLAAGEPAVLFLRRSQYGPYFVIWGGEDGKLPVRASPSGAVTIGAGASMDLDGFAAWVEATGRQP
jgi:hypothetical protein